MTDQFDIDAAKAQFSRLAGRAAAGEEIIIARRGRPIARLVAIMPENKPRQLGALRGRIRTPMTSTRRCLKTCSMHSTTGR